MIFIINVQIMNFKDSSILVKTFIDKTLWNKKGKPGISYILDKMLSLPALTNMLTNNYSIKEILSLGYMVHFLFEGDDMVSAEWKSKNDIYVIDVTEVGDVDTPERECLECEGTTRISCDMCDGEGEVDCPECDGEGCENCGGGGEPCNQCDGDGDTECQTCDDSGIWYEDEQVYINREMWVISNFDTIQAMKEISEMGTYSNALYDLLDANKGGFYLAGIVNEFNLIPLDEFERNYGDYSELQNQTMVNRIINLRDLDLSKLPKIRIDSKEIKLI